MGMVLVEKAKMTFEVRGGSCPSVHVRRNAATGLAVACSFQTPLADLIECTDFSAYDGSSLSYNLVLGYKTHAERASMSSRQG